MSLKQFIEGGDDRLVRQYTYDDGTVVVADLRVDDDAVTIEVLEGVVLVVVEGEGSNGQFEIPIPEDGDAQAFINNGVLTIEVGA